MPALQSPLPLRASQAMPAPRPSLERSPLSVDTRSTTLAVAPPILMSPTRLSSPFTVETPTRRRLSHSSAPCDTPPRRHPNRLTRLSRQRRRLCARTDCTFESYAALENIPWISVMHAEPDTSNASDIADLSQLDVDDSYLSPLTGPIRQRKSSANSRTNPLSSMPNIEKLSIRTDLPIPLLPSDLFPNSLKTPPPRADFSMSHAQQVVFHELLPVFSHDVHHQPQSVRAQS